MHIKSVREVKPIVCSVCGCEYQWEVGDEMWAGGHGVLFLNCPVCNAANEVEFGDRRLTNEENA